MHHRNKFAEKYPELDPELCEKLQFLEVDERVRKSERKLLKAVKEIADERGADALDSLTYSQLARKSKLKSRTVQKHISKLSTFLEPSESFIIHELAARRALVNKYSVDMGHDLVRDRIFAITATVEHNPTHMKITESHSWGTCDAIETELGELGNCLWRVHGGSVPGRAVRYNSREEFLDFYQYHCWDELASLISEWVNRYDVRKDGRFSYANKIYAVAIATMYGEKCPNEIREIKIARPSFEYDTRYDFLKNMTMDEIWMRLDEDPT